MKTNRRNLLKTLALLPFAPTVLNSLGSQPTPPLLPPHPQSIPELLLDPSRGWGVLMLALGPIKSGRSLLARAWASRGGVALDSPYDIGLADKHVDELRRDDKNVLVTVRTRQVAAFDPEFNLNPAFLGCRDLLFKADAAVLITGFMLGPVGGTWQFHTLKDRYGKLPPYWVYSASRREMLLHV